MKRASYGLLLLAAIACSVSLGVMTYVSAVDSGKAQERDRKNLAALQQESWYLPLNGDYDGIHQITGADQEIYGALHKDQEILMDRNGKILLAIPKGRSVFEPQKGWVSSDMESDGEGGNLLRFYDEDREKYGFMDLQGNIAIKAAYEQVTEFTDGYAIVEDELGGHPEISVIIDRAGRMVYDPTKEGQWNEWFSKVQRLGGSLFLLRNEQSNKARIFDAAEHSILKEIDTGGRFYSMKALGEGRCASIDNDDGMRLLDQDFEPVSEAAYTWMDGFSEGLCFVKWKDGTKTLCGYIDGAGRLKIEAGEVLCGSRFHDGKAFLWSEDHVRVIDKTGRTLFEKKLAEKLNREHYQMASRYDEIPEELAGCWFRDGLAVCYDGSHYGIVDAEGNWRIQPVLDYARFCGRDAAVVSLDAKEGIWKAGGEDER